MKVQAMGAPQNAIGLASNTRLQPDVVIVVCGGDHTGSCYHYIRLQSSIRCQANSILGSTHCLDLHVDIQCMLMYESADCCEVNNTPFHFLSRTRKH